VDEESWKRFVDDDVADLFERLGINDLSSESERWELTLFSIAESCSGATDTRQSVTGSGPSPFPFAVLRSEICRNMTTSSIVPIVAGESSRASIRTDSHEGDVMRYRWTRPEAGPFPIAPV
jgi:hypothetical protein